MLLQVTQASVNRGHPLCPTYWWIQLPNNQGGIAFTDILTGQKGALSGATSANGFRGTHRRGGFGHILFDNTSGFIDLGSSLTLLENTTPFTLSWWEYVNASSGTFASRFRLQVKNGSNGFLVLRSDSANYTALAFAMGGTATIFRASGGPSMASSVGVWHHWVLTGKTGPSSSTIGDFTVYVDGQAVTTTTGSIFSAVTNNSTHFGYDSLDNAANCLMDDIRFYPRVLTAPMVADMHCNSMLGCLGLLNLNPDRPFYSIPVTGGVHVPYYYLLNRGRA